MNLLFFLLIAIAIAVAASKQLSFVPAPEAVAPLDATINAGMEAAKNSVNMAIGLVGAMAFFLGLVKVAEAGGLLTVLAKLIRPLMVRLFPEVPPNHPAMGAMILNMSANALGLGNAATPFGLRAMRELDKLNGEKGTATNAMVLFLAINTSSVTILPTGVMVWRQTLGSTDMAGIVPTTLFATLCSTTAAILAAKLYGRFSPAPPPAVAEAPAEAASAPPIPATDSRAQTYLLAGTATFFAASVAGIAALALASPGLFLGAAAGGVASLFLLRASQPDGREEDSTKAQDEGEYPLWASLIAIATLPAMVPLMVAYGDVVSVWVVPAIILGFLGFGFARGVKVYEVFIKGAREGFDIAVMIIPYLVAILVAIGMLRGSGALTLFTDAVGPYTAKVGLPAEALPMALLRPLSGSGANGLMIEIMKEHGPDSYVGYLVSTLQGSTETTFYVIAVYFGAVNVRKIRHTLAAALTADFVGIAAAVAIVWWMYGA